jgi:hypothetical protein
MPCQPGSHELLNITKKKKITTVLIIDQTTHLDQKLISNSLNIQIRLYKF